MLKFLTYSGVYTKRIGTQTNENIRNEVKNFISFMLPRYIMSGEAATLKTSNEKSNENQGMDLKDVVKVLTDYAPLSLAESWDNVGLLIEPFTKREIKRIMLTNDLAMNVMTECIDEQADMIISYHPPIFTPLKKLDLKTWTQKVIHNCLENRIAVYSPHTTWDSIPGGISDWLTSAFDVGTSEPLQSYYTHTPSDHIFSIVVLFKDGNENENVTQALTDFGVIKSYSNKLGEGTDSVNEFVGSCKKDSLPQIYNLLRHSNITFEIYNRVPLPEPKTGIGRYCTMTQPITIKEAIERVKKHTGVKLCRVAYAVGTGPDTFVNTAAVCPGSGAKVLANVKADLYVTGEMLHHDILAAIHNKATVIMTTHSDSERGFLKVFAEFLKKKLDNKVEILVSSADKDPTELI